MLLKVLLYNFCYDKKGKTRETVPRNGFTNTNQWWKEKKSKILATIATFMVYNFLTKWGIGAAALIQTHKVPIFPSLKNMHIETQAGKKVIVNQANCLNHKPVSWVRYRIQALENLKMHLKFSGKNAERKLLWEETLLQLRLLAAHL
jgi:hypothetical protein